MIFKFRIEKLYLYAGCLLFIVLMFFNASNISYADANKSINSVRGFMATPVKTDIVLTWEKNEGVSGYAIYESVDLGKTFKEVKTVKGVKKIFTKRERGKTYTYKVRTYINQKNKKKYGKYCKPISVTVATGKSKATLKSLIQTSIAPVGSTMYIWGGGWNRQDTAAGKDAKRIGLNSNWRVFAEKQNKNYNYQNTKYQWGNGLDCSGYVGWTVYNILNTGNNKKGYVTFADKQAKMLSDRGFGKLVKKKNVKDYQTGDIMSSATHIYIVIGECSDGSVLLVHTSPKGTQIDGTVTPEGKSNSIAAKLAKKYMKKYYKWWYSKHSIGVKPISYLTDYEQMRWYIGEDEVMSDPDGYRDMTAEKILKNLYVSKLF